MDIWVKHAPRKTPCINCTKDILPGDRVVIGRWKHTYSYGTRTRQVASHLSCWVTQTEIYLDEHPYEPRRVAGPGRPARYTPEQARERGVIRVQMLRWTKKQQEYVGQAMWAMAGRYKDKVEEGRRRLDDM